MDNYVDILKLADELGKKLKETETIKAADAAEAAYDECAELQALIEEYGAQQTAVTQTQDVEVRHAISARMEELYNEIMAHPVYSALVKAREDVSDLMNTVNEAINFAITSKHACSGNCSSCGGGCH